MDLKATLSPGRTRKKEGMTVGFSLARGLADSGTFDSQLQYRGLVSPPPVPFSSASRALESPVGYSDLAGK